MNSSYFGVEYSRDAKTWAQLETLTSYGESVIKRSYRYTYTNTAEGIHHYRLKMVDMNGTYGYIPVSSVRMSGLPHVTLYPNLASARLFLKDLDTQQAVSLTILTSAGLQVYNSKTNLNSVKISNLPVGFYILLIEKAGESGKYESL